LVRSYGRDASGASIIEASDDDLLKAVEPLVGANAAFIREAVERAKLAAVGNGASDDLIINAEAVSIAAKSMSAHLKLLDPTKDMQPMSGMEAAGSILCQELGTNILRTMLSPQAIRKVMVPLMERDGEQIG